MDEIKALKDLLNQNLNNPEALTKIISQFENKLRPVFILEIIIELLQTKKMSKNTELILWEKAAQLCEKIYEFRRALGIYKKLYTLTGKETYLTKLEILKNLKIFEKLKDLLKKLNLSKEDLISIYNESLSTGKSIEYILIEKYKVPKEKILEAIKNFYQVPVFDLKDLLKLKKVSQALNIKKSFFIEKLCLPFEHPEKHKIILVCYYPKDKESIETVKKILQLTTEEPVIGFAIKEDILEAIERYFSDLTSQLGFEDLFIEEVVEEVEEEIEDTSAIEDSVIVQLVNKVIEEAYMRGASDIHWESLAGKKGLQIRFRVDGDCFVYSTIPEAQKRAVISRIKIMANLDISQRRLPQDGKIKFKTKDGKIFELRVATIPTIENNEDVVMRILGGLNFRTLEEIDLREETYEGFKKILSFPYGLILVVGPTGSGKTTTLHAALKYLNQPNKKIWTAEDPVEIVQEGLRQVQINPKTGLTFARVLRAFLRADPDIIMIGETRDQETAHTLIEASLTGHLVLSTLHTNSAPETIVRLLNMGIDPYNFADALLGILAQRLAKRLCPHCKEPYTPTEEEIERLKREYGNHPVKPLTEDIIKNATFYKPVGCSKCNFSGFKGRIAIHELLIPDDDIKKLIVKAAPANEIRELAIQKGFLTLKQDGILKVLKGETTLRQIQAVTVR